MRDASFETKQREKKTRLDRKIEDLLGFNSDEKSCKEGREQRIRCWTSKKKSERGDLPMVVTTRALVVYGVGYDQEETGKKKRRRKAKGGS